MKRSTNVQRWTGVVLGIVALFVGMAFMLYGWRRGDTVVLLSGGIGLACGVVLIADTLRERRRERLLAQGRATPKPEPECARSWKGFHEAGARSIERSLQARESSVACRWRKTPMEIEQVLRQQGRRSARLMLMSAAAVFITLAVASLISHEWAGQTGPTPGADVIEPIAFTPLILPALLMTLILGGGLSLFGPWQRRRLERLAAELRARPRDGRD